MRRNAPVAVLVSTALFFVILNVLLAQAIVLAFYPNAGTRLGPAGLGALCVLAIVCAIYALRGWRAYLRPPSSD